MFIALDTEVPGLHRKLKPFMITACDENGSTRAWEWPVDPFTRRVKVNPRCLREIATYLTGHEVIFHHGQFDLLKFSNVGLRFSIPQWTVPKSPHSDSSLPEITVPVKAIHETMLLSHLADSRGVYTMKGKEPKSSHALKDLCLVRLGISDSDEARLRKAVQSARLKADKLGWKKGDGIGSDYWLPHAIATHAMFCEDEKTQKLLGKIPPDWLNLCRDYGLRDVRERTMMLFLTLRDLLQSDGRWSIYEEERLLIPIYYMMEMSGLRIDPKRYQSQITHHQKKADEHECQLKKLAKNPSLNINSDPQLRKLLFDDWGITPSHYTPKKKEPSVNAAALEEARDYLAYHPNEPNQGTAYKFLCHLIGEKDYEQSIEGRTVIKSPGYRQHISSLDYLKFYEKKRIGDTFHATIYPCGTGTTRISSEGSQNVGKKKVDGISLRNAFGPEDDWLWVSIDYEQLELRIFAALSGDQSLIDAFNNGYDFHAFVASKIFNLSPDKISSEQRRIAKNTNFAMIYGGSPWKVDATAGMKGAYDLFSSQFPSAKEFMDATIAEVKANGFITTADGYPLYAPPDEPFKATDYKVQGTAGRIIKRAMQWLMYDRHGKETFKTPINWSDAKMILQIHDELLFAIRTTNRTRNQTVRLVRSIATVMEEAGQSMGITTPVSCSIHKKDWGNSVSLKEFATAA